jgi:Antitoxin Xre/MbcA/ParS C-terminal toxin-binding domain/Antitoxin Xre-like helix-turn-helix domain
MDNDLYMKTAAMNAVRARVVLPNGEERRDPAVRRRLSGPALRTFFAISRAWGLSATDERALLGWAPSSTFHKYKSGNGGVLSFDTLTRISLVLGIYKALQVLYPEPAFADRWMQMPNANPMFGGRTPMAFVTETGLDGLLQLRRLLDARRG